MEEHIINEIVEYNINYDHIPITPTEKPNKKKVRYTSAHLKAQNKYRENNREKYNEAQRLLYEKKIQEEEWQKHYLERSRINNKKYREKRKEALIESGEYVEKKRGRPHKCLECIIKDEHTDHKVYNISEIKQKTIMNKQEQFEKINELEEENNLLTENLIQSEERIKKLEEEIELLKNDEKINELEEENKLLTETLLQSEERIKKLEEEIELLKMKKK